MATTMPGIGVSSLLWFALIVAMIPLALWLLKRTPVGSGGTGAKSMRLIGALPIAPNQRLLTVEVGHGADRRWLVLGVTAQSISTLHTMPAQGDLAAGPLAQQPSFAQVLEALWSRRGGGGAP